MTGRDDAALVREIVTEWEHRADAVGPKNATIELARAMAQREAAFAVAAERADEWRAAAWYQSVDVARRMAEIEAGI